MEDREPTLGGRFRRYARVGTTVGGLAARLAGNRVFGIPIDSIAHASDLREALGGLKGPLMKVAQILATVPDLLPAEYIAELTQLQSNAPAMGWAFVKRRMASELGADWRSKFAEFEQEAAAAASLGQVHKAVDIDGRALACKLQYPDMVTAVRADLEQLKFAFALFRQYDRSIDTSEIHAELVERMREELDYRREAAHMTLFRGLLADQPTVHVPEVVSELSTGRLLTMGWVDGVPVKALAEADPEQRNRVAVNMFRAWYAPFYRHGIIHGDPHLGNYSVRSDGSVNLLDFGCVRVFPPRFVKGVIDLYHALRDNNPDLAVHAYETWGFSGLDRGVIDILNQWASFLYEPLTDDRVRRISETGSPAYGASVAAKVHKELKDAGGVRPPREFVLMDRAAIGLGSVFLHLGAEANWHRLFHELIDGFDVDAVSERQAAALESSGIDAVS